MTPAATLYWVLILCGDALCSTTGVGEGVSNASFRPLTITTTEAQCKATVAHAKDSKFAGVRAVCIGPDGSRLDSWAPTTASSNSK